MARRCRRRASGPTLMPSSPYVISPSGRDVYVAFNGKLSNYVVASHDFGEPGTFLPPKRVNEADRLWWYADGGAIAVVEVVAGGEELDGLGAGFVEGVEQAGVQALLEEDVGG